MIIKYFFFFVVKIYLNYWNENIFEHFRFSWGENFPFFVISICLSFRYFLLVVFSLYNVQFRKALRNLRIEDKIFAYKFFPMRVFYERFKHRIIFVIILFFALTVDFFVCAAFISVVDEFVIVYLVAGARQADFLPLTTVFRFFCRFAFECETIIVSPKWNSMSIDDCRTELLLSVVGQTNGMKNKLWIFTIFFCFRNDFNPITSAISFLFIQTQINKSKLPFSFHFAFDFHFMHEIFFRFLRAMLRNQFFDTDTNT